MGGAENSIAIHLTVKPVWLEGYSAEQGSFHAERRKLSRRKSQAPKKGRKDR